MPSVNAEQVHWKVQSNKPVNSIPFNLELKFAKRVAELTNNELIIDIREAGVFFPIRSTFNAVRTEQLDGMLMSPQYWSSADPVFAIMGDLIAAWDSPQQYNEWLFNDNGIQYLQNSYASFGLTLVDLYIAPHESIISTIPIRNIDDIKNQKIRVPPGMAFDYFMMIGAHPRKISLDKVKHALNRKQISMADYSDIVLNDVIGFYQNAKHTNYPGFHSISIIDFVVNSNKWNKLKSDHKQSVMIAIEEWKSDLKTIFENLVTTTLKKLEKENVLIHKWDQNARREARRKAVPVWLEYAKKSPEANRIIEELLVKFKKIGNL